MPFVLYFFTMNRKRESHLHKELKDLYQRKFGGDEEVEIKLFGERFIIDLLTNDNEIIEIQTKNLSKLKDKIALALKASTKIRIVYPLIEQKKIIRMGDKGEVLFERTSPKKNKAQSIFLELTGIYEYLLNPLFTLDVILCDVCEVRKITPPSYNEARARHKTDYKKIDKSLISIRKTLTLKTKDDYLSLLLGLKESFSKKDLALLIGGRNKEKISNIMIWVLERMGLVKERKKVGRTLYFNV